MDSRVPVSVAELAEVEEWHRDVFREEDFADARWDEGESVAHAADHDVLEWCGVAYPG